MKMKRNTQKYVNSHCLQQRSQSQQQNTADSPVFECLWFCSQFTHNSVIYKSKNRIQ